MDSSFSLALFLDVCDNFFSLVNRLSEWEAILPNRQVSTRWVSTLIARLMSWQERWLLLFFTILIIKLPQETPFMEQPIQDKNTDESNMFLILSHLLTMCFAHSLLMKLLHSFWYIFQHFFQLLSNIDMLVLSLYDKSCMLLLRSLLSTAITRLTFFFQIRMIIISLYIKQFSLAWFITQLLKEDKLIKTHKILRCLCYLISLVLCPKPAWLEFTNLTLNLNGQHSTIVHPQQ